MNKIARPVYVFVMVRIRSKHPPLPAWIEKNVRLPAGIAAEPGPIKLYPYQRGIAAAIADPKIERVTVLKSARVGYSTVMVSALAHFIVREPAPILVLMPTEADCRDLMVSDIEPLFEDSPALRDHLPMPHPGRSDRNTLLHRLFPDGSLKIVAGKAPRNLRRHTARVLLIDELDAVEVSAEGDPVTLAEKRTLSFANRKIVCGSTPLDESTSHIARLYAQSDQRIWEMPCPECAAFHEIAWPDIEWPEGKPELAAWRCPSCKSLIAEKFKRRMLSKGRWRAQRRERGSGHAGFRINALASVLPQAAWGKLAAEYLRAKDDETTLRVFVNTVLGEPWREQADEIEETALARRAEGFDLGSIPPEVLALTVGADVQGDRIEASIVGHARDGTVYVLAHQCVYGEPGDADTWAEVDKVLHQRFRHPRGGALKIDAALIDAAGQAGYYEAVMSFANARIGRRVLAGKGYSGFGRPAIQLAKTKKGRLFVVGVDPLKQQIISRLVAGKTIRFSHTLTEVYYEQLASERRVVRMTRGRPIVRFERKSGYAAEALDCLVYALAAKAALGLNPAAFEQREHEVASVVPPSPPPTTFRSQWMQRP
jgi:phage terminase large subunit GpA-like protein